MRNVLRLVLVPGLLGIGCGGAESLIEAPGPDDVEELAHVENELELGGRSLLDVDLGALRTGDRLSDRGISLRIPPPGVHVTMIVDFENGDSRTLHVAASADGRAVASTGPFAATASSTSGSTSVCDDDAYALLGHKWTKPFEWKFVASSTPSANSISAVEQRLREGADNIVRAVNSCGLPDTVSATHVYLGRTEGYTNINTTTTRMECGEGDGKNMVKFGTLPVGTLGVSCVWSTNGISRESDHKYNKTSARWYASESTPSGCVEHYSMEGVATHEFGHTFGLGHVSEWTHGKLTMSTDNQPCQTSAKTLGLGDWKGLDKLY